MTARVVPMRNIQFDALRGIAILFVMIHHVAPQLEDALQLPLGWVGVRFFFVLSGFLITGILLEGRELIRSGGQSVWFTLRQFYIRRCLRIFPIFYLALFMLALGNAGEVREYFFWHFAYLSNFRFILDGYFHNWVGHFWTLNVEEQFYLVWPAVILFTPRRQLRLVILGFVALGIYYRFVAVENDFSSIACEANPLASVDILAAGSLLAVLLREGKTSARWSALYTIAGCIGGAGLVADILMPVDWLNVERFINLPIALSLFAIGVLSGAARGYRGFIRSPLEFPPLVFVGTISYGLYIYHAIVQSFLGFMMKSPGAFHPSPTALGVISFAISFALATTSWYLIEKPLNHLKRFFPYRRPRTSTEALVPPVTSVTLYRETGRWKF